MSTFDPASTSMLQYAQMSDVVPNSSLDTAENIKMIHRERRQLNEGTDTFNYCSHECIGDYSIIFFHIYNRTENSGG